MLEKLIVEPSEVIKNYQVTKTYSRDSKQNKPSEVVKNYQVGIRIVEIVGVRWVMIMVPIFGFAAVFGEQHRLWFAFIVHTVESNDLIKTKTEAMID